MTLFVLCKKKKGGGGQKTYPHADAKQKKNSIALALTIETKIVGYPIIQIK
jgi:hypothetical protein